MKRTNPAVLVIAAVLGGGVGFLIDQLLTSGGAATVAPHISMALVLALVGVVVLAFAIPIRRAIQGRSQVPIDPFRALRVVVLAKASSLVGAALGGGALGLLVFLLTRPVTPSVESMTTLIATVVASAWLVAAALIAEHLCIIRKDDDDHEPGSDDPGPGVTPSHH
ncbi:DUF3180 domain-containing protein [Microbacterium sp. SORGH_AS_0888]|uniref:DUF3180 domain-containing protein n=1 Tax=Microbacterium sp. SORGH_AS_0888 TaxID=3041791 RepID=UPI00278A2A25|nr:DUF3180 domain-containing protein [Microbacterium sp. SORGH_AS_0888]MDQ1130192.1 hypothetical protein [Microbacterium sp. SORGH_AS_0888]